jgi:hypothetical protein
MASVTSVIKEVGFWFAWSGLVAIGSVSLVLGHHACTNSWGISLAGARMIAPAELSALAADRSV